MPRIRSIYPNACRSDKLAAVSAEAERFFWRLQTACDDEGRAEDHPSLLWAECVPLVSGANAKAVDAWLAELHEAGLLRRYAARGKRYLQIERWGEYQKPKNPSPSKLPSPDEGEEMGKPYPSPGVGVPSGEGEGVGGGEGEGEKSRTSPASAGSRASDSPQRESSRSPPRPIPAEAERLARLLADRAADRLGPTVRPHRYRGWAEEIRKLHGDGRGPSWADIEGAIEWLYSEANEGEFRIEVQSGRALREKWSKIVAAHARRKPPRSSRADQMQQAAMEALEIHERRKRGMP